MTGLQLQAGLCHLCHQDKLLCNHQLPVQVGIEHLLQLNSSVSTREHASETWLARRWAAAHPDLLQPNLTRPLKNWKLILQIALCSRHVGPQLACAARTAALH